MEIAVGTYVKFVFDDADVPPMLVTYISSGHIGVLGRDWNGRPFDLTGVMPAWLVAAPSPVPATKTVGDPMHGPDSRGGGFQQHDQGRPDFGGGDFHYHDYHGNFDPFRIVAPVIGGLIGQQVASTTPRPILNPQTGLEEIRTPGYWGLVNGAPAYIPLACWVN